MVRRQCPSLVEVHPQFERSLSGLRYKKDVKRSPHLEARGIFDFGSASFTEDGVRERRWRGRFLYGRVISLLLYRLEDLWG